MILIHHRDQPTHDLGRRVTKVCNLTPPPMSSFTPTTTYRPAAKPGLLRLTQAAKQKRFHWRFIPGSRAVLELAYDARVSDDFEFLPAPKDGRVRRKAKT